MLGTFRSYFPLKVLWAELYFQSGLDGWLGELCKTEANTRSAELNLKLSLAERDKILIIVRSQMIIILYEKYRTLWFQE